MNSNNYLGEEGYTDNLSIFTTHKLARELLNREDKFLVASYKGTEFIIENLQLAYTHANMDDSSNYIQLNLRECNGNIKR